MAEELSKRLRERERAEAVAKPVEKAQREEPVELHNYEAVCRIRTKALELAIESFGDDVKNQSSTEILYIAQRFYTYITKGE